MTEWIISSNLWHFVMTANGVEPRTWVREVRHGNMCLGVIVLVRHDDVQTATFVPGATLDFFGRPQEPRGYPMFPPKDETP